MSETTESTSYTERQRAQEGGASDPDWHPWNPGATSVHTYADVKEVLTSSKFQSVAAGGSEPVWAGVLTTSNGPSHLKRRRWLAPLVSRSAVARFDAEVLDSAMNEFLGDRLHAEAENGPVDIIPLLRMMLMPIVAGFVGIDDVDSVERSERLRELIADFVAGSSHLPYAQTDPDALVDAALKATAEFREDYFLPSRERRATLVERFRAGDLTEDELPNDVLVRQLLDEEGLWDDTTLVTDALILITGGLHTTAVGAAQVLDAYYGWSGRSESDADDVELIHAVINETLRVFPVLEFLPRKCLEDTTLKSGKHIEAGTDMVLNLFLANRDQEAFGEDADTFRPGRYTELSSAVQPYGLAFGAGPHICIGRPLVAIGRGDAEELDVPRIISKVIIKLLKAGVHPAEEQEPVEETMYRRTLATYPVNVPRAGGAGGCPVTGHGA